MSLPVFENPKSPFSVAKLASDAWNPITDTTAVLAATVSGALTTPTVIIRSTAVAVLL